MTILALAGVCTRPEYRKQGLGSAVIKACFARVDRGELPFCLFQTTTANRPFYEHLGCSLITNRIINSLRGEARGQSVLGRHIQMAYPAARPFPKGVIDLSGRLLSEMSTGPPRPTLIACSAGRRRRSPHGRRPIIAASSKR